MKKKDIRGNMDTPVGSENEDCFNRSVILEDGRVVFLEDYNPHTNLYSGTDETGSRLYVKPQEIKKK